MGDSLSYWTARKPVAVAEIKTARIRPHKVMREVINILDLSLQPRGFTLGSSDDLFVIFIKYHYGGKKQKSNTYSELIVI